MAYSPERQTSQFAYTPEGRAAHIARLRLTIEIKLKLRAAFQSDMAIEDNERQLHMAEDALSAAEAETG